MLQKLNVFFTLLESMQSVNTSGIEPMAHPTHAMSATILSASGLTPITLRLRDDVVSEPDTRAAHTTIAPSVEKGLFLVPKVID